MKGFLQKTKEAISVGTAKVDAKLNDKHIEDDPEFLACGQRLLQMKAMVHSFENQAAAMSKACREFSKVEKAVGKALQDSVDPDDDFRQVAEGVMQVGEKLEKTGDACEKYYMPTYVLWPLQNVYEEIKRLEKVKERTKKHKVLMGDDKSKLKSATKNGKDVEKYQKALDERKALYEQNFEDFKNGVDALWEKRRDIYERAYNGIQHYMLEVCEVVQSSMREKLTLDKDSLNEKYGSLSVIPTSPAPQRIPGEEPPVPPV